MSYLFTIIPLNAAKSDILAMQTIGRGLRLRSENKPATKTWTLLISLPMITTETCGRD